LRQIEDWAGSRDEKSIYWLTGGLGTGKSTIAVTLARRLNEKGLLAASFFFAIGYSARDDAKRLFSALAAQLVIKIPELAPGIQEAVKKDPYISEKVPAEQFDKLLLQPLMNLELGRTIILVVVLDALDECRGHDIKLILKLLPRTQKSKSVKLRFFVTSRPEMTVRFGFESIRDHIRKRDLCDIHPYEVSHDISMFLENSLSIIRYEWKLPVGWPGKKAMNDLVAKSESLFIYAASLCRHIQDSRYHPEQRLQDILSVTTGTHEPIMAWSYIQYLERVFRCHSREGALVLSTEFRQIVGPMIMLASPLSLNAFSRLLGIPSSATRRLVEQLHSVLIVPDNPDSPVRPIHASSRVPTT
jgi:hypothetical protein